MAAAPKILPVKRVKATVTIMINVWEISFVETITAHGEIEMTAVWHHRKPYSEILQLPEIYVFDFLVKPTSLCYST